MAKEDVRWGYKNVPIHPSCWTLLGFTLNGVDYVDTTLPFGLAIAPWVFSQLTMAIRDFIMLNNPNSSSHAFVYLDDFLLMGAN